LDPAGFESGGTGDAPVESIPATLARITPADRFSITDFGAVPDDGRDDSDALREALEAASRHARRHGTAIVELPAGAFDLAPEAGERWVWEFGQQALVAIQGAGLEATVLRLHAAPEKRGESWRDPATPIERRGGLFMLRGPGSRLALADLTIDGMAPPTPQAGHYPGASRTGWDTSHKAIGCWDAFAELRLERVHVRRFRGEMVYAGGDERNGLVTLIDCVLSECNASAISCTASMRIEGLELFDCYNGIENFLFPGDRFVMRRSLLQPGRSFPQSKFAAVFLGPTNASVLIEDCFIESGQGVGQNASGPLYFAEFCHNVTVRETILANGESGAHRVGISNYAAMQANHPGFTNFHFERVEYLASRRNVKAHYRYGSGPVDWSWTRCTARRENGLHVFHLGQFPGGCVGTLTGNDFSTAAKLWEPVLYYSGTERARFDGTNRLPEESVAVFRVPSDRVVIHRPRHPGRIVVGAWPDAPDLRLRVDPASAEHFPQPFQVEYATRRNPLTLEWPEANGGISSAMVRPDEPVLLTFDPEAEAWSD